MNEPKTSRINERKVNRAYNIVNAIANINRLKIMKHIDDAYTITPSKLAIDLDIEQPIASLHLGILKRAKLVVCQRHGKCVNYKLNYKQINNVNNIAKLLL